jgi:ribonuclease HI
LSKNAVEWNNIFVEMGVEIEYRWVLYHEGVAGNENADEQVKSTVERVEGTLELVKGYKGWSMAKMQRRVMEAK